MTVCYEGGASFVARAIAPTIAPIAGNPLKKFTASSAFERRADNDVP